MAHMGHLFFCFELGTINLGISVVEFESFFQEGRIKMKKMLILLNVLVLVFSITACSGRSSDSSEGSESSIVTDDGMTNASSLTNESSSKQYESTDSGVSNDESGSTEELINNESSDESSSEHVHVWYPIYKTYHYDAEYQTIHHEAETHTVHHEAEYQTIHHEAEYTEEEKVVSVTVVIEGVSFSDGTAFDPYYYTVDGYYEAIDAYIASSGLNEYETCCFTHEFSWEEFDIFQHSNYGGTGASITLHRGPVRTLVNEAWDETVLVNEAWDETVVDQAAYDETILIQAAYDEQVIEYYQCECGETKTP